MHALHRGDQHSGRHRDRERQRHPVVVEELATRGERGDAGEHPQRKDRVSSTQLAGPRRCECDDATDTGNDQRWVQNGARVVQRQPEARPIGAFERAATLEAIAAHGVQPVAPTGDRAVQRECRPDREQPADERGEPATDESATPPLEDKGEPQPPTEREQAVVPGLLDRHRDPGGEPGHEHPASRQSIGDHHAAEREADNTGHPAQQFAVGDEAFESGSRRQHGNEERGNHAGHRRRHAARDRRRGVHGDDAEEDRHHTHRLLVAEADEVPQSEHGEQTLRTIDPDVGVEGLAVRPRASDRDEATFVSGDRREHEPQAQQHRHDSTCRHPAEESTPRPGGCGGDLFIIGENGQRAPSDGFGGHPTSATSMRPGERGVDDASITLRARSVCI